MVRRDMDCCSHMCAETRRLDHERRGRPSATGASAACAAYRWVSQHKVGRTSRTIALALGGAAIAVGLSIAACAAPEKTIGTAERGFTFSRFARGPGLFGTNVRDHLGSPFRLDGVACPEGMADIQGRFCIDRYEGSLLEDVGAGREQPFAHFSTIAGRRVRAVSRPHVFPQAYISGKDAQQACAASGKRLCRATEWSMACRGPSNTTFPYGERHERHRCNDYGISPRGANRQSSNLHQAWDNMNDPRLNQTAHTVSRTGDHDRCTNDWGVFDMVGNLHEWVDDPSGTFLGGYYLDTSQNGDGCTYQTTAHSFTYHDYSTGFRCCKDTEF
jgi:formylglycine-generating enzyme